MTSKDRRIRILCVGDGDFTLSLALLRAYGTDQIDLTASTLLASRDELIATYSNSAIVLKELEESNVSVRFGIDATQLHHHFADSEDHFDIVKFSHPHLGLDTLEESEAWHAERHHRLISHYLWSAQQVSLPRGGVVHVCLCGRQPETWRLLEAASRHQLQLRGQYMTHTPLSWLSESPIQERPTQPHYAAPRKYRNGKLGSKHYLGKFGYQHRPTHPTFGATVNVEGSYHFVFKGNHVAMSDTSKSKQCTICNAIFESEHELQEHFKAPALPNNPVKTSPQVVGQGDNNQTPSQLVEDNKEPDNTLSDLPSGPIEWSGTATATGTATTPGQRLRQVLRDQLQLSKRQAEDRIKYRCVTVNGSLVLDSGRTMNETDQITVHELSTATKECRKVEIIYQDTNWIVVHKPVGMRSIGSFSEETLESIVSQQLKARYKCISKLDTGCSGLSLLQRQHVRNDDGNHKSTTKSTIRVSSIQHVFTVLVHGQVEVHKDVSLPVDMDGSQRWRKKKRPLDHHDAINANNNDDNDENDDDNNHNSDNAKSGVVDTIAITCLEQCCTPPLSTMTITTRSPEVRVDSICFALRNTMHHAIVNDRYHRVSAVTSTKAITTTITTTTADDNHHDHPLPRSIRNKLKNRLCIACLTLRWNDTYEVTIPTPERLSAQYWERHCTTTRGNREDDAEQQTAKTTNNSRQFNHKMKRHT